MAFMGMNTRTTSAFTLTSPLITSTQTPIRTNTHLHVTAEERAKAAMEEESKSETIIKQEKRIELGGRPFPLSMVVGQEAIKQALLLSAVNHRMGGVVISGGKGTAKSVMARALHQLLPPIEIIKGSAFNIDPEGFFGMDDFLKTEIANGGTPLDQRETEVIPAPFVQVPLNVMEDRLIGSSDLEESVKTGKSVFSPGLLAKAHRGVLYVDDINLLDEETANILLNVVNDGYVLVEREGISLRYPCRPLLICTFNPDEGELRDHLLDRIAVALSADADKMDVQSRVEAVDAVLNFNSSGKQGSSKATMELEDAIANEEDLKTAIIFAREYIKDLKLAPSQIQYLCEEAIRAGCQGHRAELFASEVARASAALEGRQVTSDDLRLAVKLAIASRGIFINTPMDDNDMQMPPPPPPPPPPAMDD
jgi:magnesium chelatase subunit D